MVTYHYFQVDLRAISDEVAALREKTTNDKQELKDEMGQFRKAVIEEMGRTDKKLDNILKKIGGDEDTTPKSRS